MADPQKTIQRWRAYFSESTTPDHISDTEEFYQFHAQELRLLFGARPLGRILEIGCGNGAMYHYLGFDRAEYRGVDFSPSMLATFKAKHPEVDVICAEGSSYVDRENKYDLIFSDLVVQHFDLAMLDRHFACARSMVHKDSLFICASVPWRVHRYTYLGGLIDRPRRSNFLYRLRVRIAAVRYPNTIGIWYDLPEFMELSKKYGFCAKFYGSLTYPYRFHAVMGLK